MGPQEMEKSKKQQLFDDMRQIEDIVDSIEIPARGRCRVYMAKYGYDPFKQSPNDNPDAELAFNAGDYIMVFDDIDEDGYFIGELMDGRRGYVPSNWLDRLTGEDLYEFQANTLYKTTTTAISSSIAGPGNLLTNCGTTSEWNGTSAAGATALAGSVLSKNKSLLNLANNDDLNILSEQFAVGSDCQSFPPEFYDALLSDTINHTNFQQYLIAPEDYQRMNDYVNLDDVDEVDDECLSDYERAEAEQMRRQVPPPQRLVLERQLNKSILIGWLHPQATKGTIVSYQVYVDGVLKSTVPSGDRTKALLEGVDSQIPHRISVRAIDLNGRHSNDAGCTIVIGKNIPFSPSCVKASHITSDSALISWLPCDSNFHHVVAVNSVEVQTVRPGVYKHLINGLSANTLYRVWVRAKPGKILSNLCNQDDKNPRKLESLTTYVDFKTMPKSLPDPPVNVQVEAGPQRRTLLVTWLPLTLNDYGNSNGCAVTGYAVFAGHKKLADIDSPTSDHALLDISDLESLHKKSVTVRTKSGENLSQDSMPCQIPDEYLKSNSLVNQTNHVVRHSSTNNLENSMSTSGHHSPMRHNKAHHLRQHHQSNSSSLMGSSGRQYTGTSSNVRSRHLAKSLQNLDFDLDSRRSSIPAIEVTKETSGSELMLHQHHPHESYSEEEFASSMRFKSNNSSLARQKLVNRQALGAARYSQQRARQLQALDGGSTGSAIDRYQANDNFVRYFVALFDYDPATMSPNPNAASEELAFKEGSIIKIHGDKGPDGFYRGELDNHFGYVPSNVVQEISDPNVLFSLQEKNKMMQNNLQASYQQQQVRSGSSLNQQAIQQQQQVDLSGLKRMVALYDYDPQENSPNADTESEIPFKVGDIIYVYGKMDTDGFYMGEVERTKQTGLVPSNFLREEPLPPNAKLPPLVLLQQQQLKQQQQPILNQMVSNPSMMMQSANNHQPYMNQSVGTVQQQQQPLLQQNPMDASGGVGFNPNNQPLGNKINGQNNLNNNNNLSMRPNNIRGIVPTPGTIGGNMGQNMTNQPMLQTNNLQQGINRPTTLSLGLNSQQQIKDWNSINRQQVMPQQPMINQQGIPGNVLAIGQQQMNQFGQQSNQQMMLAQQQQQVNQIMQNNQLQQQQQQHGGGVLSNLLSSGKQIIGAATTPRAPNQPGQFSSLMGQQQPGNMMMGGPINCMMDQTSMNNSRSNLIHNTFNSNTNLNDITHGVTNAASGSTSTMLASSMNQAQQQQQPGTTYNTMSGTQQTQMNQNPQQQQQHHFSNPASGLMAGLNRGLGGVGNPMGGHNQGQQTNHMSGEGEQGGPNLLNTMKNIFKL